MTETSADGGMEGGTATRNLRVGETSAGGPPDHATGEPVQFPLEETLRGRTFICGKSGSGKSNSASVLIEKILDAGRQLLIIDVEGEYYGLKESYEVLHAGADDVCDIQVGPEHGQKLAELSIRQGVPIILDLSGFLDEDTANDLVGSVARELFATAKQEREPFPVFVEECHEFLPQQGSAGETGEALVRISKRGRKHGLGLVGISQRPASVDKEFITQCNMLIWHRLTWDRDTKVVSNVLGSAYEAEVDDLADGEAFLNVDPDVLDGTGSIVSDVLRVQFDRKRTYDAGEAPGLGDETRPELQSVDEGLVEELQSISDREQSRQDDIERLRNTVERRNNRIEELEEELADTKDIRGIMDDMVGSLAESGGENTEIGAGQPTSITVEGTEVEVPDVLKTEVMEIREGRRDAEELADDLERERDRYERAADHLGARVADRPTGQDVDALRQFVEEFGELTQRHGTIISNHADTSAPGGTDEELARLRQRARDAEERAEELETQQDAASASAGSEQTLREGGIPIGNHDLIELLRHEAIQTAIDHAAEKGSASKDHYSNVLGVLSNAGDMEYRSASDVATNLSVSATTVREVLNSLQTASVLDRQKNGRGYEYAIDRDALESRIAVARSQAALEQPTNTD